MAGQCRTAAQERRAKELGDPGTCRKKKVAATSAIALSVTTPAMYALSGRGIDASYEERLIRNCSPCWFSQVIAQTY